MECIFCGDDLDGQSRFGPVEAVDPDTGDESTGFMCEDCFDDFDD